MHVNKEVWDTNLYLYNSTRETGDEFDLWQKLELIKQTCLCAPAMFSLICDLKTYLILCLVLSSVSTVYIYHIHRQPLLVGNQW